MADDKVSAEPTSKPVPAETMARVLDLSPRRLYQLTQAGIIPKVKGGYELVPAIHAYINYLRARTEEGERAKSNFAIERARLYKARADQAEMQRQHMLGHLIHREQVEASWIQMVLNFRAKLLGMAPKIAPRLVGLKSAVVAQQIVAAQINEALDELATSNVNYSDRGTDGASGGSSEDAFDLEAADDADGE